MPGNQHMVYVMYMLMEMIFFYMWNNAICDVYVYGNDTHLHVEHDIFACLLYVLCVKSRFTMTNTSTQIHIYGMYIHTCI